MGMIHFPSSSLGPILYSPCILLEYVFSDFAHIILVQREISLGCPVLAVFYRYGQYFGKNVIKDCSGRVLAMDFSRDCSRSSGQHSWEGLGHAMLCYAMLCRMPSIASASVPLPVIICATSQYTVSAQPGHWRAASNLWQNSFPIPNIPRLLAQCTLL